eukprot:TRINITY_DN12392_c0_g1_i1.p1 TRINITY_DN12392_c0_g1~~TRINITY_DN12392_c0_g1_i1.p1  ORF type:complete len:294 (+),score=57.93 TRINITY_DN12392_c0_g1_i1:36-917(+)
MEELDVEEREGQQHNDDGPPPSKEETELLLHAAVIRDQYRLAELLLTQYHYDPNCTTKSGITPLHLAVWTGNLEMAVLLIQNGADVNANDQNGWSPLHFAARRGHEDLFNLLLDSGAKLEHHDALINFAARGGSVPIVKYLLSTETGNKIGVNSVFEDPFGCVIHGSSPLHSAASSGNLNVVHELLEFSDVNIEYKDLIFGRTALIHAVVNNHVEIAELLLKAGADIEATDNDTKTVLDHATELGLDNMLDILLDHPKSTDNSPDPNQNNKQIYVALSVLGMMGIMAFAKWNG